MIEELAAGAQFKLPYLHVMVNNAHLGLFAQAHAWMEEHRVPEEEEEVVVVVEIILERVANIAMGTEINATNKFEALLENRADALTAIAMLH